jgi:hypothetical protein
MFQARLVLPMLLVLLAACRPEIGDECVSSIDCSSQGDRLCDTSQPEGYCTIFSCEPDNCPEDDSVCVGFGLVLAPTCDTKEGAADPRWPRFERTFCMAPCEEDDDCRVGYQCLAPEERGATSIDIESELLGSKVCFAASEAPVADPSLTCAQSN